MAVEQDNGAIVRRFLDLICPELSGQRICG
jgi:hypothetical protein